MIPHLMNCPHIGDGWCLDCMRTMIPRAEVALAAWRVIQEEAK